MKVRNGKNKMIKKKVQKSQVTKNIVVLMLLNIVKILLPFITLPYLARVLTTDCYGTVAYVKAIMGYMQLLVDFGFLLSATKHIAEQANNKEEMGRIVGDITVARSIIAAIGMVVLLVITVLIPIVRENVLFTFLSYIAVVLTIFLMDFVFRGIEKMEIITYRFLIMKLLSTTLTFVFIKGDSDILWIPILDIIGSVAAIILVFFQMRKEGIRIQFCGVRNCFFYIKESFIYFLSNIASTSFNAFNTIVMGLYMSKTDVAYWSICIQCISAVLALVNPVSDAIYPEMVKTKSKRLLRNIVKLFIPIVAMCCIAAYFLAPMGLYLVAGEKYLNAVNLFRLLIPVIMLGFLSILFGWPTLGAIGRVKETTMTTVFSVIFQVISIVIVAVTGVISLYIVAVIRCVTELILFSSRYLCYRKYENEFLE